MRPQVFIGEIIVDQIYSPVGFMGRHRVNKSTPARKTIQDPIFLSVDYANALSGARSAEGDVNAMLLRSKHDAGADVK